jgi:hypothetical protein
MHRALLLYDFADPDILKYLQHFRLKLLPVDANCDKLRL